MTIAYEIGRDVELSDGYALDEGRVLLSGTQAIARLMLDIGRYDRSVGANRGIFISGYPGSPLGVLDLEFEKLADEYAELDIHHRQGLNEDLAATAVWGTQVISTFPETTVDGAVGVWYGKAPGLDRSGDSIRHGSFVGASREGGLLAFCGDDPSAKSSTLPCTSERTFASWGMPVFYPGSPQEILELGRHAVHASRVSGLWSGIKIVTAVADAVATVDLGTFPEPPTFDDEWDGKPFRHVPTNKMVAPHCLDMEKTLFGARREILLRYVRAAGLNRRVIDAPNAKIGIVTAGTPYFDLREAFGLLGLDDDDLERQGIRLLKLGVISPLDPQEIRSFAEGLDTLVVIEEKQSFIEAAIREILYDVERRPTTIGKWDTDGAVLVPEHGVVTVDVAVSVLTRVLKVEDPRTRRTNLPIITIDGPQRTPYFCSGCPHNGSTELPDDALVALGIGCHSMVQFMEGKGESLGLTHMGGEGAQYIGQAPFVSGRGNHIFQNLGDGTFHHSGSLALRAAVAAGVNVTYKIFYNGHVAMTGGQEVNGVLPVPQLTKMLEAEGVQKIIVTTEDRTRYKKSDLAKIAKLWDRTRLLEAQDVLRQESGVTVLIHDQECAAEVRRKRKRKKVATPTTRVHINQRVCEGCGDCGRKSHCVSLRTVDSPFGAKTEIDQDSCNLDDSCIEGDCPSFLKVDISDVKPRAAAGTSLEVPAGLPAPTFRSADHTLLRLVGIGGTGVVTVARMVSMAAMIDGFRTSGSDQIGMAQKGGQVVSDVRIFRDGGDHSSRPAEGTVDGLLVLDVLGGTTEPNLKSASPEQTIAVVASARLQTGQMVGKVGWQMPSINRYRESIDRVSDAKQNVYFDATEASKAIFGTELFSHVMILGSAWQRGVIPISLEALHEAFRLNGGADKNAAAFAWGRAAALDPNVLPSDALDSPAAVLELAADQSGRAQADKLLSGSSLENSPARSIVEPLVSELIAYQSVGYARRFIDEVEWCDRAELEAGAVARPFTVAAARNLFKLMAYKDEYEVARLHLDPIERARTAELFGEGARVKYQLHPPILKAMGMDRKLSLGAWFDPVFVVLRALRKLRGTPLDVFGYAHVRRVERKLVKEFVDLLGAARALVSAGDTSTALEIASLPDMVRGYEEVKMRSVVDFHERARHLTDRATSVTK